MDGVRRWWLGLLIGLLLLAPARLGAEQVYDPIPIYRIQGNGPSTPMSEWWVDTVGVVTGVTTTGFYLQDPLGDGDPATSDGIFVYTHDAPTVQLGACVLVQRAQVTEFYEKTELSYMKAVVPSDRCAGPVTPTPIELPYFGSNPAELYERYEGMLVTVTGVDGVVQGPTKRLRSGVAELALTTTALTPYLPGGRVFQHDGAATAALIHLSSALGASLPDAGWGDLIAVGEPVGEHRQVTAVLDYNFGKYQLLLTAGTPIELTPRPRAEESAAPATLEDFTLCSLNLYGLGRGATQFPNEVMYRAQLRQRALVISERLQGCTIIGLQESGSPEDAQRLAAELGDIFGLPYTATAFVSPQSQELEFPLTNALLTRTDRVQVVNAAARQACTPQDYEVVVLPGECESGGFALFDRTPLVADLAVTGSWGEPYRLRVIVNHWKSKAGDETLNVERRTAQAQFVATLVQEAITAEPAAHVVVLGDLNDYYDSTPVEVLRTSVQPPLVHAFEVLPTLDRYTYIFNGASQVLDHVLLTSSMVPALAAVDIVHMNVNFPYREHVDFTDAHHASDHEPVLIRLRPAGAAMVGGNVRYPGVQLTLLDSAGAVLGTTLSDALGDFRFWNLQPGPVAVQLRTPDFLALPVQDMTLSLEPGYNDLKLPAVEHQTAALGGAAALLGGNFGQASGQRP
jgi:endonuclease/exonuclease/phosphatase family metal-dependent hydrolase